MLVSISTVCDAGWENIAEDNEKRETRTAIICKLCCILMWLEATKLVEIIEKELKDIVD